MRLKSVLTWVRSGPGPAAAAATLTAVFAAVTIFAGTTIAAAHPAPVLALSAPAVPPAPHILPFAQDLLGARLALPAGPLHVAIAWNVDGCDHDYGSASQCVPWTIPAPTGQGCRWLAAHGFGPLRVNGRDRLGLDANQDGIACDQGDEGA